MLKSTSAKTGWLAVVVLLVIHTVVIRGPPSTAMNSIIAESVRSATANITTLRKNFSLVHVARRPPLQQIVDVSTTSLNDSVKMVVSRNITEMNGTHSDTKIAVKQQGDEIAENPGTSFLSPPDNFSGLCPQEWQHFNGTYAWSSESANRCCGPERYFTAGLLNNSTNHQIYKFRYPEAPLGNKLTNYFNHRAIAYLRNQTFVATDNILSAKGLIACFPMVVPPSQVGTSQELRAIQDRLELVIRPHQYPHATSTAAFRLVPRMMSRETISIARAWSALPAHKLDVPGNNTAVVHLRCDSYILKLHKDYGVLPHRFYLDRLPNDTEEVVIVRKPEGGENACTWSYRDLIEELENKKGLRVTVRSSPELVSDWLYMARAKTLLCSPSTFCLTAAWGNPNKVYFPTCGKYSAVVKQDPHIDQVLKETGSEYPNLVWVDSDYLPGKFAKRMNKAGVVDYARSQVCNTTLYKCQNP